MFREGTSVCVGPSQTNGMCLSVLTQGFLLSLDCWSGVCYPSTLKRHSPLEWISKGTRKRTKNNMTLSLPCSVSLLLKRWKVELIVCLTPFSWESQGFFVFPEWCFLGGWVQTESRDEPKHLSVKGNGNSHRNSLTGPPKHSHRVTISPRGSIAGFRLQKNK